MSKSYTEKLQQATLVQSQEKDYIKAKVLYEEIVKEYPDKIDAYYMLAILESNIGNIPLAIKHMLTVISISPLFEAYKKLSEFYILTNDSMNALKYLRLALTYNSGCEQSKNFYARLSPNSPNFVKPTATAVTGMYESSKDCSCCHYKKIYDAEIIDRVAPKYIESSLTENQKNELNNALALYLHNETKEQFVVKIPEGRVYLKQSEQPYFIAQDNKYLDDLRLEGAPGWDVNNLPNEVRVADKMLVLATPWAGNFYHWLTWTVPRLHMIEKAGYKLKQFDKIVVNNVGFKFQRELIELLGIPMFKTIGTIPHGAVLRAKSIVTASMPSHLSTPKFVTESIRDKFLKKEYLSERGHKRIYISRNKGSFRRIANEEEFTNFLGQLGFITIYPETLKYEEQVALFANADIVISQHGAGLVNLSYCKPGTKVVEIYNETMKEYLDTGFFRICSNQELDHYFMFGEPLEGPNMDMNIDMRKLSDIFELANIT